MRYLLLCWGWLLLTSSLIVDGAPAAPSPAHPAQGSYGFVGTIMNGNSLRPVVADILIYNDAGAQVGKLQTSRNGTFTMTAETTGPYRFAVTALGYVPQEVLASGVPGAPVAFTVRLVPLEVGMKVTLNSIRFTQSKATLLPESFDELNRLTDLLIANEKMEIQLSGHTDNQGDPAQNVQLSESRVRAVQEYLTKKGIAASRVHGQGFGGSQPIASNKQEHTRKLNRRVEFEIVKN